MRVPTEAEVVKTFEDLRCGSKLLTSSATQNVVRLETLDEFRCPKRGWHKAQVAPNIFPLDKLCLDPENQNRSIHLRFRQLQAI